MKMKTAKEREVRLEKIMKRINDTMRHRRLRTLTGVSCVVRRMTGILFASVAATKDL